MILCVVCEWMNGQPKYSKNMIISNLYFVPIDAGNASGRTHQDTVNRIHKFQAIPSHDIITIRLVNMVAGISCTVVIIVFILSGAQESHVMGKPVHHAIWPDGTPVCS